MKFRASQLGKLMSSPRSKVDRFSKTAESYIITIAKQDFYGYNTDQSTNKYCLKGIHQEQDSIDLLNAVRFESYKKYEHRAENEWLTGSCDIITEDLIIDVKTSWSLETFPATSYELKDLSEYEWQGVNSNRTIQECSSKRKWTEAGTNKSNRHGCFINS